MKPIKIILMLLMFTAFGTSEFFGQTIEGSTQTTKPKRKYTKKSDVVATSVVTHSATESTPAISKTKPKRTYSKSNTAPAVATPAPNPNEQTQTVSAHQPTYRRPMQTPTAKIAYTPGNGGTYNGHQVFVGPKGGKYYINKNGNKTYIK